MPSTISVNNRLTNLLSGCPKSVSYSNFLVNMVEGLEKVNESLNRKIQEIEIVNRNLSTALDIENNINRK